MKRATRKMTFSPVSERRMQLRMLEHNKRVKTARPAIDCTPPPVYGHLVVKMKKLQLENERISRIEDENFRLLSRLSAIMHRDRKPRISANPQFAKPNLVSTESKEVNHETKTEKVSKRPFTVAVSSSDARQPMGRLKERSAGNSNLCACKSRCKNPGKLSSSHKTDILNKKEESQQELDKICTENKICALGIQSIQIKPKAFFHSLDSCEN